MFECGVGQRASDGGLAGSLEGGFQKSCNAALSLPRLSSLDLRRVATPQMVRPSFKNDAIESHGGGHHHRPVPALPGDPMSLAEEELNKADARADELRKQVREHQAELGKINGSDAAQMTERCVWLEWEIRRLKIAIARTYSPVLAALDEGLKKRPLE